MNKHKLETQKIQQIFHFDEHKIEEICESLENGRYLYRYQLSNFLQQTK